MINIDDVTKEHIKQYNPNWPQNPGYRYRLLIIAGSRSGKKNCSNLFIQSWKKHIRQTLVFMPNSAK